MHLLLKFIACFVTNYRRLGCSRRAGPNCFSCRLMGRWRIHHASWSTSKRRMLRPCWSYRKPETFYCWSTASALTCRYKHTYTLTTSQKMSQLSLKVSFKSNFLSVGRVDHPQPEDGEREGRGQEEDGRKRQTFIKKSSSDQHFTRYSVKNYTHICRGKKIQFLIIHFCAACHWHIT